MTILRSNTRPPRRQTPPTPRANARRRGACPSLAAPMDTGDGLLVRLTPRSGAFTTAQLAALADAAQAHGNGLLEISARGNLQIRGVRPDTLAPLRDAVNAAGIAPREGVPIDINPLSGADRDPLLTGADRDPLLTDDPAPLAAALRARLRDEDWPDSLGPKVAVVIDGGGRFDLAALLADVRLDALGGGLWQVALAGRRADATPLGRGTAQQAVGTAAAVLRAIAARGPHARARDLDAADLVGSLSPAAPLPSLERAPAVGLFPLTAGTAATLALPFGAVGSDTLAALISAAEQFGGRSLVPASGRRLIVPFADADAAAAFMDGARDGCFVVDPADARLAICVCAGRPACASAFIDARGIANRLAAAMPSLAGPIHISGCVKGCARPGTPVAELIGTEAGVQITAGDPALKTALAAAAAPEIFA